MSTPNPGDRKITHFVISVAAFNELTQILGNMKYKYAAAPLQVLTEGTKAVFERAPEIPEGGAGKIVDNPPEPHCWVVDGNDASPKREWFLCTECGTTEPGPYQPDPGECPGKLAATPELGSPEHAWQYLESDGRWQCAACQDVYTARDKPEGGECPGWRPPADVDENVADGHHLRDTPDGP